MFNISQYILTIVDQGTFSKAAQTLHISQPALSIAVRKLETEIGELLFDRSTSPLQLTRAGQLYVAKARQMSELQTEFTTEIADLRDHLSGELTVGGAYISATYLLPPLLKQFKQAFPDVQLTMLEAPFPELAKMILNHSIDIAVDTDWFLNPKIESVQLFENHLVLAIPDRLVLPELQHRHGYTYQEILSQNHLQDGRPKVALHQFSQVPYVLMTPSNEIYQRTKAYFAEANFVPNIAITVNQQVSAYEFAQQGWGAAFITDTLVQYSLAPQQIHFYRVTSLEQPRYVAASFRHQTTNAKIEQTFLKFATQHFQQTSKKSDHLSSRTD